jgi:hypothetical protein
VSFLFPSRYGALLLILTALPLAAHAQVTEAVVEQMAASNQSTPTAADQTETPGADAPAPQETQKPSLLTPLKTQVADAPYEPITGRQRLRWFITNTIRPSHLLGGVFTSAFGTALDRPKEYGSSWEGFGKRYGIRLSGVSVSNVMEANIGSLWGEDPRYFAVPGMPFKSRLQNVVRQTFVARQRDGSYSLASARIMAITGSNFLSNTWRADSEANTHDALVRTGEGFAGRMAANAFAEFWPSIKSKVFHTR